MEFEPFNRFILVEKVDTVEQKKDDPKSAILVPDEYIIKELHGLYKILKVSEDCEKVDEYDIGKTIIVNSSNKHFRKRFQYCCVFFIGGSIDICKIVGKDIDPAHLSYHT